MGNSILKITDVFQKLSSPPVPSNPSPPPQVNRGVAWNTLFMVLMAGGAIFLFGKVTQNDTLLDRSSAFAPGIFVSAREAIPGLFPYPKLVQFNFKGVDNQGRNLYGLINDPKLFEKINKFQTLGVEYHPDNPDIARVRGGVAMVDYKSEAPEFFFLFYFIQTLLLANNVYSDSLVWFGHALLWPGLFMLLFPYFPAFRLAGSKSGIQKGYLVFFGAIFFLEIAGILFLLHSLYWERATFKPHVAILTSDRRLFTKGEDKSGGEEFRGKFGPAPRDARYLFGNRIYWCDQFKSADLNRNYFFLKNYFFSQHHVNDQVPLYLDPDNPYNAFIWVDRPPLFLYAMLLLHLATLRAFAFGWRIPQGPPRETARQPASGIDIVPFPSPPPQQALAIRYAVFVEEQGVPPTEELDDSDALSRHYLVFDGDTPVGTGRIYPYGEGWGKIGRIAILKGWRGRHLGRQLMHAILADPVNRQFRGFLLDAQIQVIPFYEKLGFTAKGDFFTDAGILHRRMYWEPPLTGGEKVGL